MNSQAKGDSHSDTYHQNARTTKQADAAKLRTVSGKKDPLSADYAQSRRPVSDMPTARSALWAGAFLVNIAILFIGYR